MKLYRFQLVWMFLLCLLLSGCSGKEPVLPSIYSEPSTGKIIDFGPQGLMATKTESEVSVNTWQLEGDEDLSMARLSFPARGKLTRLRAQVAADEVKLFDTDSEHFQRFLREPVLKTASDPLVGLWRYETKKFTEWTEYTPWGTVIWLRLAEYQGEDYVVGGWARYQTPEPGRLDIQGREFNYDIKANDKFRFAIDNNKLTMSGMKMKGSKKYTRATREELLKVNASLTPPSPSPSGE